MNINRFSTVGYFIKHYFNWSMDASDLENLIEHFFEMENQETINDFRNEVKILYLLNDTDIIREVFYKLGNRGIKTKEAISIIKNLYKTTENNSK